MRFKPPYRTLLFYPPSPVPCSRVLFRRRRQTTFTAEKEVPMRKVTVTTGALITQGAAESTPCEVLPFPEGRLSGCDARNGHGRSAQSSCLVSETLTARERDILAMIGQGLSNKRIARAREISPETVKSHVKHIF